ncbi:peptidylprolyl isomerase [Inhella crocodyli]|uniref:peptidylprolyl isomerase n=2 Tax=Inhella crocodyli TaxID=2499851 RepID=A0A437LU06_9BURK|nr:peptidylprolyl isomerase [Inhella crocodyli]
MLAGDAALAQAQALDAQAVQAAAARKAAGSPALNTGEVMNATTPDDWREPDPQNVVLMEIRPSATAAPQQVWMELAPRFAPEHAANIRALVRGGYFDGLAVLRVQDNFVTQWGDPGDPVGADNAKTRPLPEAAKPKLPAEFDTALAGLPLHALVETDGWAPLNGFVDGFPVAADPAKTPQGRAWLAHCYGVVGAGRGNEIDSSNGASLYAVIGHSPRPLDLNITVVGRILKGIEHLAALPRGGGNMGFYKPEEARPPLMSAKLLADLPAAERPKVQVLRTDTLTWANLLHTRRYRGGWYVASSGRVDLCSSTVPVRVTPPTAPVNP